jgi:hypothetical protein
MVHVGSCLFTVSGPHPFPVGSEAGLMVVSFGEEHDVPTGGAHA